MKTPIYSQLLKHKSLGYSPFHTPGHKNNNFFPKNLCDKYYEDFKLIHITFFKYINEAKKILDEKILEEKRKEEENDQEKNDELKNVFKIINMIQL